MNLRSPIIEKDVSLSEYKFVVLPNTTELTSSTGSVYGNEYGAYGASTTKSVNPSDVIEGILLKKGFKSLDEVRDEFIQSTLIVKYGESGKRHVWLGMGYTIEVTISFYSADDYDTIYSCTAEGIGDTEADDIRKAINRCLSGL